MAGTAPDPEDRDAYFDHMMEVGQTALDGRRPLAVNAAPVVLASTKDTP